MNAIDEEETNDGMMGANQTYELHNISTFWFFVSHSSLSNATEISTNNVNIITNLVPSSYYLLKNYTRII